MKEMYQSVNYNMEIKYYVPCFQIDPDVVGYPSYEIAMHLADSDEQFIYSMKPDYVLELTGHFKSNTNPYIHPDVYTGHGNGD